MSDELRSLIAPLERLGPAEALGAVRVALRLGRSLGREAFRCGACRGGAAPPRPDPRTYYLFLVDPWWRECGLSEEERCRWSEAFADGTALRDPRVQAFSAGLAESVLELGAALEGGRELLRTFLEVPAAEVEVRGLGADGRWILGCRGERFLVLPPGERVRPGGLGPARAEETEFIGHRIVRWRVKPA